MAAPKRPPPIPLDEEAVQIQEQSEITVLFTSDRKKGRGGWKIAKVLDLVSNAVQCRRVTVFFNPSAAAVHLMIIWQ